MYHNHSTEREYMSKTIQYLPSLILLQTFQPGHFIFNRNKEQSDNEIEPAHEIMVIYATSEGSGEPAQSRQGFCCWHT